MEYVRATVPVSIPCARSILSAYEKQLALMSARLRKLQTGLAS